MSETNAGAAKDLDPMEKLRELRDAYLEVWSKQLIETVNTDSYAQASGALLNGYLAAAAPLKEPAEQAMLRTLQQLNMPSSADFAGLAGRFTNIEMQLDNVDAKLDRMEKLLTAKAAATAGTRMPAESVLQAKPVKQASDKQAETRTRTTAGKSARKAAPTARGTAKRTTTARPVRRTPRKGTR